MTSRYAAVHANPAGAGDARPTALQIIQDDDLVGKLSNKVILITGCSSGIGIETARALKATGARLFLTARNLPKGEEALRDILEPGKVELLKIDQNSLASVRECTREFLSKSHQLNILSELLPGPEGVSRLRKERLNTFGNICNAGIMGVPTNEKTKDGFESQFGTNHLAHFLLFQLLKPTMLASATPEFNSRVVCVSSSGHRMSPIHFDDLGLDQNYDPWTAYGQSKTANILMANEIDRRYGSRGIHGYSLHPGGIWTGLQIHMDVSQHKGRPEVDRIIKSPEQGAATQVWAAVGKVWEGHGGKYLEDCQIAEPLPENPSMLDPGHAKHAYDKEAATRLWTESCRMVGVDDD